MAGGSYGINNDVEAIVEMLRSRGFKITSQRIAIISSLMRLKKKHPSLMEIHREASKMAPTISFSTVYTTLKMLEELGLVRLFSHQGDTLVEVDLKPHINVILEDGRIIDIEDEDLVKCIMEKLREHGVNAKDFLVNIMVWGSKHAGPGENGNTA